MVDNGPGFAEPARIFAPSYTTKNAGSGMGLPVSLQIARLHGGSLTAHRPEAGGAELVLTVAKRGPGADLRPGGVRGPTGRPVGGPRQPVPSAGRWWPGRRRGG